MALPAWLDPVYDAAGMGAADRWAIERAGIPSLELMEAAGRGLARVAAGAASGGAAVVVCGKGNNGGDGLVAARHLAEAGLDVTVILLWPGEEVSPDSQANLDRLPDSVMVAEGGPAASLLDGAGVVVDALLGTGFEGVPRAPVSEAIETINQSGRPVVACDLPSGVNGSTGEAELAVRAGSTVTFHGLKLGHVIAPGKHLAGRVETVPIGIPEGAPEGEAGGVIGPSVLGLPPPRGSESTKFTSGRVSIVGGSRGLTGAVCLAAEGAIRAGAGYATVAVPGALEPIFEAKLTEVMSVGLGGAADSLGPAVAGDVLGHCEGAAAVVLGSGIGRAEGMPDLLATLTAELEAPLVVDADGLSGLGTGVGPVVGRQAPTVLTPHAGEMGRMLGIASDEVSARRLSCARELASKTGAVVVLKGDDTIVTDGERLAVNALAAPALATAGTGDVLAGVTGAFLARGLPAFEAACAAVFAHARAGRIAAGQVGSAEGVIAGDVVAALPEAMASGSVE